MKRTLAFVLSGGGARGALQVGALEALLESRYQPDLLVGTSIGAVNATFLALNGFSKHSMEQLKLVWHDVSSLDLLPANYAWLTVRAMVGRSSTDPSRRIRDFFIDHGLTPDICFSELQHPGLVIVSSDLSTGKPVLHGASPDEAVLDALLLSTALPPWVMPVKKQDRYFMDGGVVSNLPIEPALKTGATEIVAIDLMDTGENHESAEGMIGLLGSLLYSVHKRQAELEMELAAARGVPIFYLGLNGRPHVLVRDFTHTAELMAQGYEIARTAIKDYRSTGLSSPSRQS